MVYPAEAPRAEGGFILPKRLGAEADFELRNDLRQT